MSLRMGLMVLALGGLAAGPALAQSCGSEPIAPALATAAQINQKTPAEAAAAKHDAFVEIKNWQADLKTYRDCLNDITSENKRKISTLDPSKDADKIKGLTDEATAASHKFDSSVDMEERVVNEFHAVQAAYCARTDVEKASCPKQ